MRQTRSRPWGRAGGGGNKPHNTLDLMSVFPHFLAAGNISSLTVPAERSRRDSMALNNPALVW